MSDAASEPHDTCTAEVDRDLRDRLAFLEADRTEIARALEVDGTPAAHDLAACCTAGRAREKQLADQYEKTFTALARALAPTDERGDRGWAAVPQEPVLDEVFARMKDRAEARKECDAERKKRNEMQQRFSLVCETVWRETGDPAIANGLPAQRTRPIEECAIDAVKQLRYRLHKESAQTARLSREADLVRAQLSSGREAVDAMVKENERLRDEVNDLRVESRDDDCDACRLEERVQELERAIVRLAR